jgi:hypothetical protein
MPWQDLNLPSEVRNDAIHEDKPSILDGLAWRASKISLASPQNPFAGSFAGRRGTFTSAS